MAHKPEQDSQAIESDLGRLELIYKRAAANTERPRELNHSILERVTSLINDLRADHMRLRRQEDVSNSASASTPKNIDASPSAVAAPAPIQVSATSTSPSPSSSTKKSEPTAVRSNGGSQRRRVAG